MSLENLGVNYTIPDESLTEPSFLTIEEPEDQFGEVEKYIVIFIVFVVRLMILSLLLIFTRVYLGRNIWDCSKYLGTPDHLEV